MAQVQGCIVGQPTKIAWQRIREFQGYASVWAEVVARCEKCGDRVTLGAYCQGCGTKSDVSKPPGMSQIRHAIQRNLTAMRKLSNQQPPGKYQRLQEDIQFDCWHTSKEKDKDGVYTKDQHKDFELNKEGGVELNRRLRLLEDDTVDFTPYFATLIPTFLTDTELEIFSGICIRPEQVEEIRQAREEAANVEAFTDLRAEQPVRFGPDGKSEILFFNGGPRAVGRLALEEGRWTFTGDVSESAAKFFAAISPVVAPSEHAPKTE